MVAGIALAVLLTFVSMRYLSEQDSLITQNLIKENEYLQRALEAAKIKGGKGGKSHFYAGPPGIDAPENGFAYVFYASSDVHACSVLVNIHRFQNAFNVRLPIHVLASPNVTDDYLEALRSTKVAVYTDLARLDTPNMSNDRELSMLKLAAFDIHSLDPSLKRVLALDGDQLIMKNLDRLFEQFPTANIAAPRAYWIPNQFLASTFMMINLSDDLLRVAERVLNNTLSDNFELDRISGSVERVAILSGEYVTLNSHWGDWNLPGFYQPSQDINMTTVELVNELSRGQHRAVPRRSKADESGEGEGLVPREEEVTSTSTTLVALAPISPPPSTLRFPEKHPITAELHRLQEAAGIIHFTQKPWTYTAEVITSTWPDAHPLLVEQINAWLDTAARVCPSGNSDRLDQ